MVCRIIDGTRDMLVSRGMSKEQANDTVLKVRQMFFDPFAAPGHHPTTDPEFKKMLPLFYEVTSLLVNVFHYGTSRYDRERAEDFAARFVPYVKEHFPNGAPEMDMPQFFDMVKKIDEGKPTFSPDADDYDYVQIHSWEELKEFSKKYRLDKWCNVNSEEDWDRYSLYGQGKFYVLYTEGAESSYGKLDVIGIVINHYGKIVYAFDRDNDCVDKSAVYKVADEYGLIHPFAVDFSTGIDLIKAGYGYDTVFSYTEDIGRNYAMVGFDNQRETCILDTYNGRYAAGPFTEFSRAYGKDGMFILDNKMLFDTGEGAIVADVSRTGRFRIDVDCLELDEDEYLCALKDGQYKSKSVINAVCLGEYDPVLLLDKDNAVAIRNARFNTSGTKRATIESMSDGDFWVVTAASDGTQYIVDRPGKRIEDCISIPESKDGNDVVLTPNGYYCNYVSEYSARQSTGAYYLMKDGKKVFDCAFKEISVELNYDIYLETKTGDAYIMDYKTGKLRKA